MFPKLKKITASFFLAGLAYSSELVTARGKQNAGVAQNNILTRMALALCWCVM